MDWNKHWVNRAAKNVKLGNCVSSLTDHKISLTVKSLPYSYDSRLRGRTRLLLSECSCWHYSRDWCIPAQSMFQDVKLWRIDWRYLMQMDRLWLLPPRSHIPPPPPDSHCRTVGLHTLLLCLASYRDTFLPRSWESSSALSGYSHWKRVETDACGEGHPSHFSAFSQLLYWFFFFF